MGILERTREIGVLRSIGARARDVRRIFATEGLVVAVLGWALGIPLGYAMARAIGWLAGNAVGLDIAFVFPARPTWRSRSSARSCSRSRAARAAAPRRALQARRGAALCLSCCTHRRGSRPRPGPGARPPSRARARAAASAGRRRDAGVPRGDGGRRARGCSTTRSGTASPARRSATTSPAASCRSRSRSLLALAYPRLRAGRARRRRARRPVPLMIVAGVVDGVRHVAVDRLGRRRCHGDRSPASPASRCVVLGAARAVALAPARRAAAAALPAARARRRRRGAWRSASWSCCRWRSRSWPTTRRAPGRAVDLGRAYERRVAARRATGCGSPAGTCRRATAPP